MVDWGGSCPGSMAQGTEVILENTRGFYCMLRDPLGFALLNNTV